MAIGLAAHSKFNWDCSVLKERKVMQRPAWLFSSSNFARENWLDSNIHEFVLYENILLSEGYVYMVYIKMSLCFLSAPFFSLFIVVVRRFMVFCCFGNVYQCFCAREGDSRFLCSFLWKFVFFLLPVVVYWMLQNGVHKM